MTNGTEGQERKSSDAAAVAGLIRTLQSMSRRFPQTRLVLSRDAFGVQLRDGSYLRIVRNGSLTDADTRDFLVLFARWLAVDPEGMRNAAPSLGGVSAMVRAPESESPGRRS